MVTDGFDLDWLGLERRRPGHWTFEVTPGLSRFDGKFYGGTGIAVVTAAMEAETGRRALWASVQFASSADLHNQVDCEVEVLAEGRRTSQVRLTGSVDGRVLFAAIGSTGQPKQASLTAQFGQMPAVPGPEDCPPWQPRAVLDSVGEGALTGRVDRSVVESWDSRPGWLSICDIRSADEAGSRMWMRMLDRPLSRAAMGFLADVVPSGVVRAAGRTGAGTSLDNSIRFGPDPDGEWTLVDVDPLLISDGYVHGAARLWSPGGTLFGVASQTASLLLFD